MINRVSSHLPITKEPIVHVLFCLMLLDLFLGGGGRLIDIGLLSIRMYLFFIAVSISLLILYFVHKINREVLFLLAIFSITLCFSSLVALIQDVSPQPVLRDLKPLIFFYAIIFFNLMIQENEDVVKVEKLIKLAAIILATSYVFILIMLRIGWIDFARFYSRVYSTEEFYFRGNIGFMYKGFVYLCVGFFFYFRSKNRKHKLLTIFLLIAIFLTFTRGFILALACTLVVYLVLFKKNKLLSVFAILFIFIGVLMVWSTLNSSALGDKSVSNSVRIIQMLQVWEHLTPLSLITGHGFGVGVPISPVHMEIAYLEIVHKQGIIGLTFWIFLFVGICLKFWQSAKKGYFDQALPFFLSTTFVYIESFTNPFLLSPLGMTVVMLSWVCLNVIRKKDEYIRMHGNI